MKFFKVGTNKKRGTLMFSCKQDTWHTVYNYKLPEEHERRARLY